MTSLHLRQGSGLLIQSPDGAAMNRTERSLVRIVPNGETMMTNSQSATTAEAATTDNQSPKLPDAFTLHFENPEIRSCNGGQKLVYRATWKPIRREVIVKYHHDEDRRTELTEMELVAHPLSLAPVSYTHLTLPTNREV